MTQDTEEERAEFLAWIRTHEDEHGAVDEASAWAAWSARSIVQAARRAPVVTMERLRVNPASEPLAKYVYGDNDALVDVIALSLALEQAKKQLASAPVVPEGWKLVPVEPTEEMIDFAEHGDRIYSKRAFGGAMHIPQGPHDHWVAMLAAAPQPPDGCFVSNGETHAAPVELPEPVGCTTKPWGVAWNTSQIEAGTKLYTEQQMRAMYPGHPPFQTADGCSTSNGETP